jgi:hypothetical protein
LRPPEKNLKRKKRKTKKEKTKKKEGFSWNILKELCEATSIFTIGQNEEKQIQEKLCTFWGQALFAPINFSALSKSAFSAWKRIGWKFLEF